MKSNFVILMGTLFVFLFAGTASAGVLGACGTDQALEPAENAAAPASATATGNQVLRVPLPGERAPNFELAAVVGDEIKPIKLSDYDGKWRVVCFYPADFTFV